MTSIVYADTKHTIIVHHDVLLNAYCTGHTIAVKGKWTFYSEPHFLKLPSYILFHLLKQSSQEDFSCQVKHGIGLNDDV